MNFLFHRSFILFVVRFLLIFLSLYYLTIAVIGLTAPGGYYNAPVDKYFDYVSGIKKLLMYTTKAILSVCGIETRIEPQYVIRIVGGRGVTIAMDCVGYGVYSFWIAYIFANSGGIKRKILWAVGGVVCLFLVNDIRITLFLVAINRGWPMPLGIDHHTWFNLFAYTLIFVMIFYFDARPGRESSNKNISV